MGFHFMELHNIWGNIIFDLHYIRSNCMVQYCQGVALDRLTLHGVTFDRVTLHDVTSHGVTFDRVTLNDITSHVAITPRVTRHVATWKVELQGRDDNKNQ